MATEPTAAPTNHVGDHRIQSIPPELPAVSTTGEPLPMSLVQFEPNFYNRTRLRSYGGYSSAHNLGCMGSHQRLNWG